MKKEEIHGFDHADEHPLDRLLKKLAPKTAD